MAEIWAASIGATVIGGYMSGKAAEKKDKSDKEFEKGMTREQARLEGVLSSFNAQQEDYYNQLNRGRKQRGLEQFRQFSTVGQFAPVYQDTTTPISPGQAPTIEAALNASDQEAAANQPQQVGGGGGGRSTIKKILDPLGGLLK